MPFKSQAQRRLFYALKAKGKMTQETIDEWESDTPKDIPERLVKKAEYDLLLSEIAHKLPTEQLVKLANYDFEKDAVNIMPWLQALKSGTMAVGKGMAKSLGRGVQYTGEAVANIAGGGRNGLTMGQVVEPLRKSLNKQTLSPIKSWDPFYGLKQLGKVKQVHSSGPLKGSYKYKANASGDDLFEYANLPEGVAANLFQRAKNIPKNMWQTVKGNAPTRADYITQRAMNKGNPIPSNVGEMNESLWKFMKNDPRGALWHYGKKGTHWGLMGALPAYEVGHNMVGGGDPNRSTLENTGRAIGSGLGFTAGMPVGFAGGIGLMDAGEALGGKVGRGLNELIGGKRKASPSPLSKVIPRSHLRKAQTAHLVAREALRKAKPVIGG